MGDIAWIIAWLKDKISYKVCIKSDEYSLTYKNSVASRSDRILLHKHHLE